MRKILSSKKLAAVAVAAVAVTGTGVAYAYWSTTGSGSGEATVANPTGVLALVATFEAPLYPGADDTTITYSATNPNSEPMYLETITVVPSLEDANGDPVTGCTIGTAATDDFQLDDLTVMADDVLLEDADTDVATGTLSFNNLASNQNDCKDATVVLDLSSSDTE